MVIPVVFKRLLVSLLLPLFLLGCEKPPTDTVINTERLIEEAKKPEADVYARDAFLDAENTLKQTKESVAAKKYKAAKISAEIAAQFAREAMTLTFIGLHFLTLSCSLVLIIILAHLTGVAIIGSLFHEKKEERVVMMSMLPRGLASAVLATMPIAANIKNTEAFVEYTFAVIVLTNILMTVGVFITERDKEPVKV